MLVLSRKKVKNASTPRHAEVTFIIDPTQLDPSQPLTFTVSVVDVRGDIVKLGIDAPLTVDVKRSELLNDIEQQEHRAA